MLGVFRGMEISEKEFLFLNWNEEYYFFVFLVFLVLEKIFYF